MFDAETGTVSLPFGVHGDRHTKYDTPFLTLDLSDPEVKSATDGGWPTVIADDAGAEVLGVAADYPAQWHDTPAWEIDVWVDSSYDWWVLVEFEDLSTAEETGRYRWNDHAGVERRVWDREERTFKSMRADVNDETTPIYHVEDHSLPAFAIQRATSYSTLERLFDLGRYDPLEDRRQRLEVATIPREERWENEDTSLQDLAAEVLDEDQDEPH